MITLIAVTIPAYLTALAALATAVINGLRWRAHGELDDERFAAHGHRISQLENGHSREDPEEG